MAKERLDKLLAHEGFGSRKDIRKLLRGCEVLVNGSRTYDPATQVDAENDSITSVQFQNRMTLRAAMMRHGFKPFPTEWWHFTLANEPFPDTYFTFPVRELKQ